MTDQGRDGLLAEVQDLLPVDRQDRLVIDLLTQPQGVTIRVTQVAGMGPVPGRLFEGAIR